MDPTYPLVPVANFIAFIFAVIPLSTTLVRQSWNVGVCMLGLWLAIMSLINVVNTIVWADNTNDIAPVWCDISDFTSRKTFQSD